MAYLRGTRGTCTSPWKCWTTYTIRGDGDTVIEGDSLILAFDPTAFAGRGEAALAYYVSARSPPAAVAVTRSGGREQHSAGRPRGTWRDSSVYEIAVKAGGGRCVYEPRIPWSELGISPAFGGEVRLRHPTERQRRPWARPPR